MHLLFLLLAIHGSHSQCTIFIQKTIVNRVFSSNLKHSNYGIDEPSGCFCRIYPTLFTYCLECARLPTIKVVTPGLVINKLTTMTVLQPGAFRRFSQLQYLEIAQNDHLGRIKPGAFEGLVNVQNLSLKFNLQLHVLEPGVFANMGKLDTLVLVRNGFNKILDITPSLTPNDVPLLDTLYITENVFQHIRSDDFSPMEGSPLSQLYLVSCQIENAHPNVFLPLKNLTVLHLDRNSFSLPTLIDLVNTTLLHLPQMYRLGLSRLNLKSANLKSVLDVVKDSNLSSLILCFNKFYHIDYNTFPYMPNIRELMLTKTSIVSIHPRAFEKLPHLKQLYMGLNHMSRIVEAVQLKGLEILYMKYSNIDFNEFFQLGNRTFEQMSSLIQLTVSYIAIDGDLRPENFIGLNRLMYLDLTSTNIYVIQKGTFKMLPNLRTLDLSKNPFLFRDAYNDFDGIFEGLTKLTTLYLSGCEMTHLRWGARLFDHLESLEELDLSDNNIVEFHENLFVPLVNLRSLTLSSNQLVSWSSRLFSNNNRLEMLDLRGNKLITITIAMAEDVEHLKVIDMSDNIFYCSCTQFGALKTWLKKRKYLPHIQAINFAYCVSPKRYASYRLFEFMRNLLEDKECNRLNKKKFLIAPLVSLIVIVAVGAVTAFEYRQHIRYWLFLLKLAIRRRWGTNPVQQQRSPTVASFSYDAFVSYSHDDQPFIDQLLEQLENREPPLKLCIYERDFQIGSVISDAIMESVYASRHTLLVISEGFMRSQWCRWETQLAEHHKTIQAEERCSIILVRMKNARTRNLTPLLRYLVKTRKYLLWEGGDKEKERQFWKELRQALLKK